MSGRVLVVAVHPDDETLGCGGTLLKHASDGDTLHWLLLTAAHEPQFSGTDLTRQADEVQAVKAAYPFASLDWLRFPTTRLDGLPLADLVDEIRKVVARLRPEIVFVPNRSDAHSDHRVGFQAALAVLKPFHLGALGVRRVLACEVPSETDAAPPLAENAFVPNLFVDVSTTLDRKLEIMALFKSQLQAEPMPRSLSSLRALARHRGSTIGVESAEAFALLREIA